MDLRELKGLELAARVKITCVNGIWYVPSQSGKGRYEVRLSPDPESCTCEDFQLRQKPCKHIYAARNVREREYGGEQVVIDTDTLPIKKTYKQDWPLYNKAQMTEFQRFLVLLHDLVGGVEEPPQPRTGRRRTLMADMVYASALKVYMTFASRRFAFALEWAKEKGYVSQRKMHPVSVCAFLESDLMTPVLQKLIVQSSLPLVPIETVFAPDSSGFSTSRYVRWYDEKYGVHRSGRAYVKTHIMTGAKTNIVTAVEIGGGDSPQMKPLLEQTAKHFTIKEVPADKAYLSHDNLALIEGVGGTPFIPFKCNSLPGEAGSLWEKMYLYYAFRREEFLTHYHQRSNVESTFSMVQAKFKTFVRSKTDTAMKNEVLCKFLCHNIVVAHQSQIELKIEPVFWPSEEPAVLPFAQPG
jgi:hypothetical protein